MAAPGAAGLLSHVQPPFLGWWARGGHPQVVWGSGQPRGGSVYEAVMQSVKFHAGRWAVLVCSVLRNPCLDLRLPLKHALRQSIENKK